MKFTSDYLRIYRTAATTLLVSVCTVTFSQPLAGIWSGMLTQEGKQDTFEYTIDLSEEQGKLYGTATSVSADGKSRGVFEVGGVRDRDQLIIQEVLQLEPPKARWCLKHMRLTLVQNQQGWMLDGNWEAEGCTPGRIRLLAPAGFAGQVAGGGPAPVEGRYTGHLSQSDRDYGFFFEMELLENGTGVSRIFSDGEGGNAVHRLNWSLDEITHTLSFRELEVTERSVADWPWCLKSGDLSFSREENRLGISGRWSGYIEGFTPQTGACAPGSLYLEKPVFKKEEITVSPTGKMEPLGVKNYINQQKREVEVDRVLEVKSKTVRIRVWDSGTIDGDILSLFVNGELILENYRVTRRKHETILKLDKPVNYLILHAINLGSISPNTVAVSVDDGIEEQVVIMSSNLDKSGAIMIRQFVVE